MATAGPIYRWECVVNTCERTRCGGTDFCSEHRQQWATDKARGVGKAAFLTAARGLERHVGSEETPCRICPQRPAGNTDLRLCQRHYGRWIKHTTATGGGADFTQWLGEQRPGPGYGSCLVTVCVDMADSPLGLCSWHDNAYRRDDSPGRAVLPERWWHRYEQYGQPVPVGYSDQQGFRRWCTT